MSDQDVESRDASEDDLSHEEAGDEAAAPLTDEQMLELDPGGGGG